ncbi:MAG: EutN/CcmL family microcompartment protein [Leptospiraceae bacterium]|nr:EutN/CcmL family microcompartment protein [Leptospiraceae bacterium]MCB1199334.1 EutN/CcmL family microcompartment protein [Leptospiraceae bacterium]
MILGEVIGTVICDKITETMQGKSPTFLLVEEVSATGEKRNATHVVLDLIGANKGEWVLLSQGSSVRQTAVTKDAPIDAVVAGIVDIVAQNDREVYHKYK